VSKSKLSLDELGKRAMAEHHACVAAAKRQTLHAMACGDYLITAKRRLAERHNGSSHGHWHKWLKKIGMPDSTASHYMRLARGRETIEANLKDKSLTVSDLPVRGAIALLTQRQRKVATPAPAILKAPGIQIVIGDARNKLKDLPSESVNCVITSPPYWKLVDNLVDGQIGLQPTPEEYVAEVVNKVMAEAWRILKPDGTAWLNIGDTHIDKNLALIPDRIAIALKQYGWIIRQKIIWEKPDKCPEFAPGRPTTSHEYILFMSKNPTHWSDFEAIKQPSKNPRKHHQPVKRWKNWETGAATADRVNIGSIWRISKARYRGLHPAIFPDELVERMVLAGCPKGGTVLDPFGGAATTALVAKRLGRSAICVEINPAYAEEGFSRLKCNGHRNEAGDEAKAMAAE
jgi:site-specific DNA-methyltransferase (adenine-specific)